MTNKRQEALMLLLSTDAYKLGHKDQYPKGTTMVYSNLTPRRTKTHLFEKVYVCGVKDAIIEMNQE
jgi:nicotinamide phosphoribosyltransferase